MNDKIKIAKFWIYLIFISIILLIFGHYSQIFLLEAFGIISSTGALSCEVFDIGVKIFRKKHGDRYK